MSISYVEREAFFLDCYLRSDYSIEVFSYYYVTHLIQYHIKTLDFNNGYFALVRF